MTLAEAFGRWLWRAGVGSYAVNWEVWGTGHCRNKGGRWGSSRLRCGRPRMVAMALGVRLILEEILEVETASFALPFEVAEYMGLWKICEKKFTFLAISVLNFFKKYISFRCLFSSLKIQVL